MTSAELPEATLQDPAYRGLRTAVSTQTRPLAVFVGAGLSASVVPTWGRLRDLLIDALRRKAATYPPEDARRKAESADRIGRMPDLWLAFKLIRDELGLASFQAEIREHLAVASSVEVPELYRLLWRLPIQGMVTLNLDSFMVRAYSQEHTGKDLKHFTGQAAAGLGSILHGRHSFALSMHGMVDDVSSWIFTSDALHALMRSSAYKLLMNRLLVDYTLIFVGVTVDDIAVGGFLQALRSMKIDHEPHYWITDRRTDELDSWAENSGIRVIRYNSVQGHHLPIKAMLEDLLGYVEPEIVAAPVVLETADTLDKILPSPDELVTYPLNTIRTLLNGHASKLLSVEHNNGDSWNAFERFSEEYIEVIHRAWFTTDRPPNNMLFQYTLEERIAQGAFGRVYRGTDAEGNAVAVKVLLDDIREDMGLRKSFRRGVAAMKILESAQIEGMVAYREASEIPAFVSMDWVIGPNLAEAKRDGLLNGWWSVLTVARDLTLIIRRAHQLPQAVLHRDIRPANIMLRDGYNGPEDWSVVVLDFDLSTYRGANEVSVLAAGSALGYLAPEQLDDTRGESTRNANVDSFGIGMTLLFLCSGKDPQAFQHLSADYYTIVKDAVSSVGRTEWQSLPRRVERIIIGATKDRQSERWDASQIIRELERLISAWNDPESVVDADLLAEELAARSMPAYSWDGDLDSALSEKSTLTTKIAANIEKGEIVVSISWSSRGDEKWSNLSKFLAQRVPRAVSRLSDGPWTASAKPSGPHDFSIEAHANALQVARRFDDAVKGVTGALSVFNFESV